MALYGAAKAPAVPKYGTGTKVGELDFADVELDTGDTYADADVNASLQKIVDHLNALIDHLNDGRR